MTDTAIPHEQSEGNPHQHAGGPPKERFAENEHPTHDHDHDPAHDNSPEAIKQEIRKYLKVFGALAVLTIITVGIAQLHLPTWQAVSAVIGQRSAARALQQDGCADAAPPSIHPIRASW